MRKFVHVARCRLAASLHSFEHDRRGAAAVEFAMIVPIMFLLLVGTIEFSQALTVDRRVTQSASSSADLIARAPASPALTTADVDGSLKIIEQLIEPYELSRLNVKVVSVIAAPSGAGVTYKVSWSRDNTGGTPYSRGSTYTGIPAGLLASGESVVVAEATYNYVPLIFHYFITSAFDLKERFYLKPRNGSCVRLTGVAPDCTAP